MSSIAFLDPVSPIPYGGSQTNQALGGTEATVLRVARRLSLLGHKVVVAQTARARTETDSEGVLYLPYDVGAGLPPDLRPDKLILLRADKLMKKLAAQQPQSRRWLWLHCFPGRHRRGMVPRAAAHGFGIVTVSEALRRSVLDHSPPLPVGEGRPVEVIYNPVDVSAAMIPGPRQPNKLVNFSSPHKGLPQVLENFAQLRRRHPNLELFVANPGYLAGHDLRNLDGVVDLGALPHREVLRHVAEAYCVFCAQSSFAETFGLVFAEANALGTPVIAHPLGAAPEVLGPSQLVDCRQPEKVIALFESWRAQGPPVVGPRAEFSIEAVGRQWSELLLGPATFSGLVSELAS